MTTFCTYAHYTPSGSMFYIGKGTEFRSCSKKNRNKNWHNIVQKNGGFKSQILAYWPTEEDALSHEMLLIDSIRSMGINLANITSGGQGVHGLKHTDKTKNILRLKSLSNGSVERCKAMAVDPDMIAKRKESATGKTRSDESKKKMALAKQYKAIPITVCNQNFLSLSEFSKFVGRYETTIRRWKDANQWHKLEEAYRAKIS